MNTTSICRKKAGLLKRIIITLGLHMRGINIIDSIKLLYGIFRFSIDLITKGGNEDRVFAFSYYLPGHKPIIIKFRDRNNDLYMALRPKTGDAHDILIGEYYELHNWFYPSITNGIFIDVGAHVGGYTIRACKDTETVIAIEPQPDSLEMLKKNAEINNCHNVITINEAVGDREGTAMLVIPKGREQTSHIMNHHEENADVITVKMDTLDNILSKFNLARIDLIKIDIEGAETLAIKGMKETLDKTRRIIIEVRPQTEWIIKELEQYGFKIIDCIDHGHVKNYFLEKQVDENK